jgi:hypothetical protein
MKRLITTLAVTLTTLALNAQTAREEIKANKYLSGSQYLDYNRRLPDKPLTPAPKGYEPFYMSHYGRHGSRWLIAENSYIGPRNILRDAKEQGKLTPLGEETLQKIEAFEPTSVKRLGDLSTVGERQHHGIGKRMTENFPEIFKAKNVPIDARSTVVIRCILSMVAECEEMAAANPTARFHNDVSESLQYYLNQPWDGLVRKTAADSKLWNNSWRHKYTHPERLMKALFNDQDWVYSNLRAGSFMRDLFEIAANMQSHDTDIELFSLFTDEEIYDLWKQNNIGWYLSYGPAPQSKGIMPFSQRNLLKNIIETADTVSQTQATLRFGHEVCVMPLACLLELGNCAVQVENLDELDQYWQNYKIFPMGCNVQLIFYRPKKAARSAIKGNGDILVKALLNEREVTLPIQTDQYPYYNWQTLRQYYLDKLATFDAQNK